MTTIVFYLHKLLIVIFSTPTVVVHWKTQAGVVMQVFVLCCELNINMVGRKKQIEANV